MTTDKKTLPTCPLCEQGVLDEHESSKLAEYKGVQRPVPLYFSCCSVCGTEQANAKHLRANKRLMQAFKKEVDGLLTGAQIRQIRESFELTQADAAQVFGGGPVAFSKYESEDVAQSEGMDKLLRVAHAVPAALTWLKQHAGFAVDQSTLLSQSVTVELNATGTQKDLSRQRRSMFKLESSVSELVAISAASIAQPKQAQWIS